MLVSDAAAPVRVGITMGDPAGIGPELTALVADQVGPEADVTVFGDARALGEHLPSRVRLVQTSALAASDCAPGEPTDAGAHAQVACLEAAAAAAKRGDLEALVTAPISKTSVRRAGLHFDGHTEFLASRLGAQRVAMMFAGPRLRVVLATIHVPLADVSRMLTTRGVADAIELTVLALTREFAIASPRVGVVGLNPHAGEAGLFGREEGDIIEPAIADVASRVQGAHITGPLVPDAAFRQALEGRFDALVAMYHDQGLIPVKLVDFEEAVNVTLGLPIVRTSPDHGVAYDIAGKSVARPTSMLAAYRLAVTLGKKRRLAGVR